MVSLLLAIIYLAFISLGLPDSLLGSAWPVIYRQFDVPLSYAGIVAMIIAGGTIISSLLSDRLTRKFGAGLVTASSVFLTALALFGFSISNSFILLCVWAVPYGLGAGAVDAALNNYVALHYAARHMSWLHSCWGIGASISPNIMSFCLTNGLGWNNGYRFVAVIQIVLSVFLFLSLPLWKRNGKAAAGIEKKTANLGLLQTIKISGVKFILPAFLAYGALESTTGLWASSYLVNARGINADTAAKFASLFYFGITFGRFLCGFVSRIIGDKHLIRIGIVIILVGIVLLGLPSGIDGFMLTGLVIIGFGCAPIYPSIIHATPATFGEENSQAIIGIQMASAYIGSTFMPPLFGAVARYININVYPLYLLFFLILMLVMSELLNKTVAKNQVAEI
jgi:fucose permease